MPIVYGKAEKWAVAWAYMSVDLDIFHSLYFSLYYNVLVQGFVLQSFE